MYKRQAEDIPTASLEFLHSEGGYDLRLSKAVLVVRGLEVAFVPVSYTHLDVYKRQAYTRPAPQSLPKIYLLEADSSVV